MKRALYFLIILLGISFPAKCQDYYWYKGKQIPLQRGNQHYILYEENGIKKAEAAHIIEGGEISFSKGKSLKWGIMPQPMTIVPAYIVYQTPSFLCPDTTQNMYVTHRFYVKLKQEEDFAILQDYVSHYHAEIEQIGALPSWYIIRCGYSTEYNALVLANIFYESGLFAVSEPEFSHALQMNCVNDTKFNDQWNLNNTGQYGSAYSGIDINYCDAHAVTKGDSSVIIGVYDLGVELTHPDINIYPFSYDVHTQSSPSTIYTINNSNYHGTACAGVIGAKTDNNLGVAGIAPDCPIMSLSFADNTTAYKMGLGFKIAADSGCSVISNSWDRSSYSAWIDECIRYALTNGRGGKGCVVVFSAGNNNCDSVNYPANSNDSIIVVGAMSPCGQRCNPNSCDGEYWGSNYGAKLDIMAPGVKIPTTDLVGSNGKKTTDYMVDFNGTSSACPHVAAIAGLILSVNPYLTQKEVADIIESTAQKIGVNINYEPTPNRPNGSWNNHFGYGLVDASAAVLEAQNRLPIIQGQDYMCMGDTITYQLANVPTEVVSLTWEANAGITFMGSLDVVQGQGTPTVRVHLGNNHIGPKGGIVPNFPPINPPFNHNAYVKVMITMADNTIYTVTKNIHGPQGQTPVIEATPSTTPWISGTTRNFTITNNLNTPNEYLEWRIVQRILGNNDSIVIYDYGRTINYTPTIPPLTIGNVTITATNTFETCGEQSASLFFGISNTSLLSAYVDNDQLNVSIHDDDETHQRSHLHLVEEGTCVLELWHNLYGCMQTKQVLNSHEQMNISSLPQGLYVLLLKEEDTVIAQTKIQIP